MLALVLVAVVAGAIWYINEEGQMRAGTKDSFIPYNSAVVVSIHPEACRLPEVTDAFAEDLRRFSGRLLPRAADSLRANGYVLPDSYMLAARLEGKSDVALLYVMDNRDVFSRNEIAGFLSGLFAGGTEVFRRYDRHKIYTLKQGKETVYVAVCGGIILLSDSDLYIEDALKQFDQEETDGEAKARYQNLGKYFSLGAGLNIFLNTGAFTDLLPLYVQTKKVFPNLDMGRFFKWGALDAEFGREGICLNGFLDYDGLQKSYLRVLGQQAPLESVISGVLPARLVSLELMNLNRPAAYFQELEGWRHSAGRKDNVSARKRQFATMFGGGVENELRELLQGEFAVVDFAYNEAARRREGLVMAVLKSGSLCRVLLDKMMQQYARFEGKDVAAFRKEYRVDSDKAFGYYEFPAVDFVSVYWGEILGGLANNYVFVEDNYLVFASSEKVLREYMQDYIHGSFVRDAEWFRRLKTKLSSKYNLAYFARTADAMPLYRSWSKEGGQADAAGKPSARPAFPSWALQWSAEGNMLYNTVFLSVEKLQDEERPHVLWQTKLDAKVTMKPVPVVNHVNGEREVFVQDDNYTVYLINDVGRILWKQPVDGKINSEVYQVDLFKNGKLQYLFSTPDKMYLIDRNGNAAGAFPVAFRSGSTQGLTLFDYDQNRDYRIFVPGDDRQVYLYGLDGKLVQGWAPQKADKPIVSKVRHFRVGNKDYIVFADCHRLYILDRKGRERVKVPSVFDLPEQLDLVLSRRDGQAVLVFPGKDGAVHTVDFAGHAKTFRMEGVAGDYGMNVADVNGNGADECVVTSGEHLLVYTLDGKKVSDERLDGRMLDFPYIYRFSGTDTRIGVLDLQAAEMLLLSPEGVLSKGFPIAGDSPFSIVFSGSDGFFLFAGTDGGSVIKYRVQR